MQGVLVKSWWIEANNSWIHANDSWNSTVIIPIGTLLQLSDYSLYDAKG